MDIELNVVGEIDNESGKEEQEEESGINSSTVRWQMGSCDSVTSTLGGAEYHHPAIYIERCCIKPGVYTLVCYSTPPAQGWKRAFIKIDGHHYCDNFVRYKSFEKMVVTGNNSSLYFIRYNN